MAYLVNQTNGTLLATVLDGAVDRAHAGIALIGKQVTNYGEIQNENYVRITENFSSASAPANPLQGQTWWNSTTKALSVYDGTVWSLLGPLTTVTHANVADLATTALTANNATSAANALLLGGFPAEHFMVVSPPNSTTPASFPASGLEIGGVVIKDDNGTTVIANGASTNISFRVNINSTPTEILNISQDSILPSTLSVTNIGSPSTHFDSVYANTFYGQAASAKYADLAEKYLADAEYEEGTVLMVGGEKEVTQSKFGKRAIGVVSLKPAYLMNSELEGGTCVALKGRVPVKVFGTVSKGDYLCGSGAGCAVVTQNDFAGFAVALETNTEPGVRLVECLIL